MDKIITAIVAIAAALTRIADALEAKGSLVSTGATKEVKPDKQPKKTETPETDPITGEPAADASASEEATPEIKVEDLQALAQKAVKKGRVAELKVWLSKKKEASVGTMDPKNYAEAHAFLTKLAQ